MSQPFGEPSGQQPPGRFAMPGAMAVAVVVFLLVYGVELATFSISIDEEVATFLGDSPEAWLSQGRWGMALLTWGLPEFEAVPLLSTALFGAGLLLSTRLAIRDLALGPAQAIVFAIFHVGFPLWLHIAQFSTLAGGFGIGLAAAAYGAGWVVRAQGWGQRMLAVVCIVFAIAVYQTLIIYAACYLLFAMHGKAKARMLEAAPMPWRDTFLLGCKAAASLVAALVLYAVVQKLCLSLAGMDLQYVGGFVQSERLQADPVGVARQALAGLHSHVSGTHPIYLEWGGRVWLLAWLGLLPLALLRRAGRRNALRTWPMTLLTAVLAALVLFAPFLLSAGYLPARAHVALPLFAAWLAAQIVPSSDVRLPALLWVVLAYVALVLGSIGQSMFYADRVARDIDASLTARLLPKIHRALGADAGKPFQIALVGTHGMSERSTIRRAEVFGISFYEHDGGSPYRVAIYLGFHGVHNVSGVLIASRPDLMAAAETMPIWPVEGSVRKVNGVVIIKFGEPTYHQLISK